MIHPNILQVESVTYDESEGVLVLLDQTLLPNETRLLRLNAVEPIWEAIHALRVRGAPAIGIAAAYGLCAVLHHHVDDVDGFRAAFAVARERLASSRPTAVNLEWAVTRQLTALARVRGSNADRVAVARRLAAEIADEDAEYCKQIGEHGVALIDAIAARKPGEIVNVLTHCNAGWLAFVDYGTATAPIYAAHDRGVKVHVWVDETRPRNQGARLTAWELGQHGVPHTVIADNAGGHLMQHGLVDLVITGADRVTYTGDAANKIGTLGVAILARHYGIPFYVCAPTSTIDLACPDGAAIPIELRQPDEIRSMWYARPMAPANVAAYNPAFDVTDHELITAIITEHGVARAPFTESLPPLVQP